MRLLLAWSGTLLVTVVLCAWLRSALRGRDEAQGPWRRALRRLSQSPVSMLALYALILLVLVALLAPLLSPFAPHEQPDVTGLRAVPPSLAHPFGTDLFSRDMLSRVLHGARVSVPIALLAVLLSATLGTAWGAVAGYAGGRVDSVMMRVIDVALAIPRVLLLIAVLALWGRVSVMALVLVLGVTGWFGVSRIVRAHVVSLREQEMVVAARALGADHGRVLGRHVLPAVLSPVIVYATLGVGNVIVLEAGLSFLGIGVQQPMASWGNMMADMGDLRSYWWLSVFPGLAILFTVMAFNTLGDGLRDALDPRQVAGP